MAGDVDKAIVDVVDDVKRGTDAVDGEGAII